MNMNYKEVYNKIIENFTALNIKHTITKSNNIVCPSEEALMVLEPFIVIHTNKVRNIIEFDCGKDVMQPEISGWFNGTKQDFHEMLIDIIKFYFDKIDNSLDIINDK